MHPSSIARAFGMIAHRNAEPLLDAGFYRDELYVVVEPPLGANLDELTREVGGAMPGFLAAEYCRSIASVLRAVHERGGFHGDVRPANISISPLNIRLGEDGAEHRRPAPDAVVRLSGLGLVPFRPPASQFVPARETIPYLPPERVEDSAYDPRGDIYGLGSTLYFLLTGRPPFAANEPSELLDQIECVEPAPLAELRPDLPAELVSLVARMMEKSPDRDHRPRSISRRHWFRFVGPTDSLPLYCTSQFQSPHPHPESLSPSPFRYSHPSKYPRTNGE